MINLAYWTPMDKEKGADNTLIYIVAHKNKEAAAASWKFFRQTFRRLERAAERTTDVLAINENALIFAQQFSLRFADGFEVGDAHGEK